MAGADAYPDPDFKRLLAANSAAVSAVAALAALKEQFAAALIDALGQRTLQFGVPTNIMWGMRRLGDTGAPGDLSAYIECLADILRNNGFENITQELLAKYGDTVSSFLNERKGYVLYKEKHLSQRESADCLTIDQSAAKGIIIIF